LALFSLLSFSIDELHVCLVFRHLILLCLLVVISLRFVFTLTGINLRHYRHEIYLIASLDLNLLAFDFGCLAFFIENFHLFVMVLDLLRMCLLMTLLFIELLLFINLIVLYISLHPLFLVLYLMYHLPFAISSFIKMRYFPLLYHI